MNDKPSKAERIDAVYLHDCLLWQSGLVFAGLDEAGRGPLAGSVAAACVIMPILPRVPGVIDSKQLTKKQRDKAYDEIVNTALFVGVGWSEAAEIDQVNILEATKLAMRRAAHGAKVSLFLLDSMPTLGLPGQERSILHGDASSYSIAAASIIAKVSRDRVMAKLDADFPQYGFARNKGYGTREHIAAIKAYGPCPAHRKSFLQGILAS